MIQTHKIIINALSGGAEMERFVITQGDKDVHNFNVKFTSLDFTQVTTALVNFVLADGTGGASEATVLSDSVEFPLLNAVTIDSGSCSMQVILKHNEDALVTSVLQFRVSPSINPTGPTTSEHYPILLTLISTVNTLKTNVETAIGNAELATQNAIEQAENALVKANLAETKATDAQQATDEATAAAILANQQATNVINLQKVDAIQSGLNAGILTSPLSNQSLSYQTATGKTDLTTYTSPLTIKDGSGIIVSSVKGLTLKNIITNGNFSNGTTGWTAFGSTISVTNNVLSNVGTSSATPYVQQTTSTALSNNKAIYSRLYARVTNSSATRIQAKITSASGDVGEFNVTTPTINVWYPLPLGVKNTTNKTGNIIVRIAHWYADIATATDKVMEVKEVLTIDLTSDGIPDKTASEVNAMCPSWFDGAKSVENVVVRSLGKNQTPTILNSGFYTAKFPVSATFTETEMSYDQAGGGGANIQSGTIQLLPNTSYYLSVQLRASVGGANVSVLRVTDISTGASVLTSVTLTTAYQTFSRAFTTGSSGKIFWDVARVIATDTIYIKTPQIDYTLTTYEPYKYKDLTVPGIFRSVVDGGVLLQDTVYHNGMKWVIDRKVDANGLKQNTVTEDIAVVGNLLGYKSGSIQVLGSMIAPVTNMQYVVDIDSKADKTAVDLKADKAQETWITPTLVNSWTNGVSGAYYPISYRKDSFGIVHLRGCAVGGTNSVVFTLPVGYRPTKLVVILVPANGTNTKLTVDNGYLISAGIVSVAALTTNVSLEGVSFYAE